MFNFKQTTALLSTIALLFQGCFAPLAFASDIESHWDDSSRVMFYATFPFGDKVARRSAPRMGLRFDQSQISRDYDLMEVAKAQRYRTLAEFRMTKGFGYSLRLSDMPVYDSRLSLTESSGDSSLGSSAENSALRAALIVLLGAAVLCAAEVLFCEDDDDGTYTPPPTDTGPGTGT